jgi:hypothetical protein
LGTISTPQMFGDFIETLPESQEYLALRFSPSSVPLRQRWRNNELSADFMAEYLITFFPRHEHDVIKSPNQRFEMKSAVSYIANELLENGMKFNDEASHMTISIQLQLYSDRLIFLLKNAIKPEMITPFQIYIQEILTNDPGELYVARVEKNASDETATGSGLGLLIMVNDYLAKLGWKFETLAIDSKIVTVTTMVQLPLITESQ